MTRAIETRLAPEPIELVDWLRRLRSQKGLRAARQALIPLVRREPHNAAISELSDWHDEAWWQPLQFGGITLERQTSEHFDFVWTVILDRDFSSRLKQLPESLTPRDLLEKLTTDEQSLIPETNAVQWVVFRKGVPVGLAMIVNINFRHRIAELIMGILPGHDRSMAVADACCASLMFAFNCLGMNKVQSRVLTSNPHAAQLQNRLGFTEEARLRQELWAESGERYEDLTLFSMLREEFLIHRTIQRHVRRRHDARLDVYREWPRQPLRQFHT